MLVSVCELAVPCSKDSQLHGSKERGDRRKISQPLSSNSGLTLYHLLLKAMGANYHGWDWWLVQLKLKGCLSPLSFELGSCHMYKYYSHTFCEKVSDCSY